MKLADEADIKRQSVLALTKLASSLKASDKQIDFLRRVWQRHPADVKVNRWLVNAFIAAKPPQREEAVRYLTVVVALQPEYGIQRTELGSRLMELGRMDEGLAQYREAIRVEPDDEFSSVRRAITTSLKQLGPAHPDAVPSMLSLVFSGNLRQPGFAAERRRLLETGLDLHQQLLSESRDDPAVLRQAGKAFAKLQLDIFPCEAEMTHRVAISVRERLLVVCPKDADSHYWLAMHQLQRGRAGRVSAV